MKKKHNSILPILFIVLAGGISCPAPTLASPGANDQKVASSNVSAVIVPPVAAGPITASPVYTVGTCAQYTIYLGYGPQTITLSVSPTSGTPPFTYSWSPAATVTSPTAATTTVNPTTSTTYSVTVTDANKLSVTSTGFLVRVKDVRCGNNNSKVQVCHQTGSAKNPTTVNCVSPNAVPAMIASGDCLGDCTN